MHHKLVRGIMVLASSGVLIYYRLPMYGIMSRGKYIFSFCGVRCPQFQVPVLTGFTAVLHYDYVWLLIQENCKGSKTSQL